MYKLTWRPIFTIKFIVSIRFSLLVQLLEAKMGVYLFYQKRVYLFCMETETPLYSLVKWQRENVCTLSFKVL